MAKKRVFVLLIRKPMLKMVRTIIKQLAMIAWTLGLLIQAQSSLSQPGAQPTAQLLDQKVLLIGLDGLMYSYIDDVDDPELDEPTLTHFPKFALTKAFVGGYLNTASHQISSSGPSWTSILTGTWTDQHGVVSNNGAHTAVPGIFSRLHTRNPALNFGSFSAWSDINTGHLVKDMAFVKRRVDGASRPKDLSVDEFVTRAVIEELSGQGSDLDFVFLHLDEIDGAGHDCGWCTLYGETLTATDARIGRLLQVISDREQNRSEQWLVMLVADHGHRKGGGHGGDSVVERTSFIGVNKPALMNNLFFEPELALELSDDEESNGLMGYPGVTSVVPTIMEYLGYPARSEDGFSAPALIGSSRGL